MPGFKGKRKGGLTLTLYKKTFRYRLPVSPSRKRTKTSSSTPNLKSPSIRTPSLLKKISFNFKIFIFFQTDFHTYSALKILLKCHFHFFGPDINRMKRPPNNFLPNQKNWRVDGEYLI